MESQDKYGPIRCMAYAVRITTKNQQEVTGVGFTLASARKKAADKVGARGISDERYAVVDDTAIFVPYPVERVREWLEIPADA